VVDIELEIRLVGVWFSEGLHGDLDVCAVVEHEQKCLLAAWSARAIGDGEPAAEEGMPGIQDRDRIDVLRSL